VPEAEAEYRSAVTEQEKLASEHPAVPEYRRDLGNSRANLGVLLATSGRLPEGEAAVRSALPVQERLAAEQSGVPEYRRDLARTQTNLGNLSAALGRPADAESAYRAAAATYEPLTKEFPDVPDYRNELAASQNNLGHLLATQSRWADAEAAYRVALAVRVKLAAEYPGVPGYVVDLGGTCCNLGDLVRDRGDPKAALPWFDRAIAVLGPVHERSPRMVTARQYLGIGHWSRAVALDKLGRQADAVNDWDRAVKLSDPTQVSQLRLLRATSKAHAGDVAAAAAEADEVIAAPGAAAETLYQAACVHALSGRSDRAVEVLRKALAGGFTDAERLRTDPDLESIRGREEFKTLVAALGAKPEPK
jgi:tetratricopeptide (TPR) repeat protein